MILGHILVVTTTLWIFFSTLSLNMNSSRALRNTYRQKLR
jgi:hypothetical protein